jgi:hypothetical protein
MNPLSLLGGAAGGGLSSSTSSSADGKSGDINYNGAFSVGGSGNAVGTAPPSGSPSWLPYALAGAGVFLAFILVIIARK